MVYTVGRPATLVGGGRTVGSRLTTNWRMQPMPRSAYAGFPQIGAFGDLRAQTGNHRMADLLWFQMDRNCAGSAARAAPLAAIGREACTRATQNAWLLERRCADYGTSAARQTAGVLDEQ